MKIVNKKAGFNYQLFDRIEAGISLEGHEAKSIFLGRISLDDAFVKIKNNEAFLVNATIPSYEFARTFGYDPKRFRRLLLHKKEVLTLENKIRQKNLILVPVSCYNKGPKIKIGLALARPKKKFEKKAAIKKKDLERETEREIRG